jgi:hypothetical protein
MAGGGKEQRMATVTLGNLLDQGRAFELRVEKYYADLRDRVRDNDVRLLTYYLSRRRRHQDEAFAGYSKAEVTALRKLRVVCGEESKPALHFQFSTARQDKVRGEDLLRNAQRYDAALIKLYKSILKQPAGASGRGLLEALIRVEERDIVMIKKMLAMKYF